MSHEDQPGEKTPGDSRDEADIHPSSWTVQNGEGSAPVTLPGAGTPPDEMGGVDPFALWAATSGKTLNSPTASASSTQRPPTRRAKSDARSRPWPAPQNRRQLLKLIAVGAVGMVTVVTVGGISFARSPLNLMRSPSRTDDDPSDGLTSINGHRERDDEGWGRGGKRPHKTPTPSSSPTPRPTPSPTQPPQSPPTPQPTPTSPPSPTPTPKPTGTVIGSTSQATNSAVSFTNPSDSQGSLLVHLSNGNWVACERACTHQGAWVNYDAGTGQLVCPAHGAIFDPLTQCSHVSGPGSGPLASVAITVNANGTITTP